MTGRSWRQADALICLCLALAAAVGYWPVHRYGFVNLDDQAYVYQNPHLRGGLTLGGLRWAFTTGLDQWMPVTWLARIVECRFFDLNPGAHHLVNVAFHIANTWLLFGVLNRMTGARWRSALVAALFALHPLHVEPVAWVTGLKDVLSTFFGLLTIWAYGRYAERLNIQRPTSAPSMSLGQAVQRSTPHALHSPVSVFYILTLMLFALALMSKPMMVSLPFVLLLLDYWPLGRTRWARPARGESVKAASGQLLKEKLPFFLLAGAVCVLTYCARRSSGSLISLEKSPLDVRVISALLAYPRYLGKVAWPTGLAVYYPLDTSPTLAAATTAAAVAGVGLAGVTAAVIWRARRAPWLVTGWFWFVGTLVPVIGLVQVGAVPSMADRYTYFSLVGLFVMLCWSVPWRATQPWMSRAILGVVAGGVMAVCAVLTRIQVGYWKDTETLFRHALKVTRGNWVAHNNLGIVLENAGRTPEAIVHYERALQIRPGYAEAHYNLGNALVQEGKVQEAVDQYEQAIQSQPNYAQAHYNLGIVLMGLGRVPEAISHWEQALRIKPDYAQAHNNLGNALLGLGKTSEAVAHYEEALRLNPNLATAHYNLGNVFFRAARFEEAIRQYTEALRIDPDYVEAHNNLAAALEQVGRVSEAIQQYEQALRLKPDFAPARNRLARLRAGQ